MDIRFVSDEHGRKVAVQLPIEDWEKIKTIHPDIELLPNDLPEWQKELLDKRMASIEMNPKLILSGEDLFEGI